MDITIIGTGFIGGVLGRALAAGGHHVTYGARRSESEPAPGTTLVPIADALDASDIVILAIPGAAVPDLVDNYERQLAGKLVIDATNRMDQPVANARASLPQTVRYARAFNTLGGENLAEPDFADGPADMFFSAPEADRDTVAVIVSAVGLQPVYAGPDEEATLDALFHLWIALAMKQGRGRRLALRLIQQ